MGLEGWVVDAYATKGKGAVRVGDAWLPKRFTVQANRGWADIDVELRCSTSNGRSVNVESCHVSTNPYDTVTTTLLREIPVAGLARMGLWALAVRRRATGGWEPVIPDDKRLRWTDATHWQVEPGDAPPATAIKPSDLDTDWLSDLEKEYGKLVEARRGAGTRSEAWWRKLEAAYLEALEDGELRGDAVANAMKLSKQAAKNAISQARKLGYNLPKGGRAK